MNARQARREISVAMRRDTSAPGVSAAAIAVALNITARAVRRRAQVESWPRVLRDARGGQQFAFPIDRLPLDVVTALRDAMREQRLRKDDARAVDAHQTTIFRDGLPRHLGARAIASLLALGVRTVQQRAKREAWPHLANRAAPGPRHLFETSRLPEDILGALRAVESGGSATTAKRSRAARQNAAVRAAWDRYDAFAASEDFRRIARMRADVVRKVDALVRDGLSDAEACRAVALSELQSSQTIRRWRAACRGADPRDWIALVAPPRKPREAYAALSPEAWEVFKADYLEQQEGGARACYARLQDRAAREGWEVPSLRTLQRRLSREVSRLDQRPAASGQRPAASGQRVAPWMTRAPRTPARMPLSRAGRGGLRTIGWRWPTGGRRRMFCPFRLVDDNR